MRLVSWNVDGLARLLETLPDVHAQLGSPDVLCLQEVRLRPQDHDLLARAVLPGFAVASALCDDPENGRFRGGRTYGVMTFVRESLQPTWLPRPAWDREGRVLACSLACGTVVNAYAPNGTSRPYFQHGAIVGTRSDFKLRFQHALADYVRPLGARILLGDWNVSRTRLDVHPRLRTEPPHAAARAHWHDCIEALELVDVYRALHPTERAYTWFSRQAERYGRLDAARVDYALLSRSLDVTGAGIESERHGSDHAPLWVTVRP